MSKKYDVIIVGSGPAGATAAFFLGQAGKRVLVLERESLPRYKTCGGAISAHVLEQFPFSFEPVIESKVKAISYALGGQAFTVPLRDQSLCMVMRDKFDYFLLKHTQAEIREGVAVRGVYEKSAAVTVETVNGEQYRGNFLIAADGANSVVARCLGLRRKKIMAAAIEIEVSVSADVFTRFMDKPMLLFGDVRTGYLWIFPKSDHLSVGIGALHPRPGELQSVLGRVMAQYGVSLKGQPQRGHPLPIYTGDEPISTSRSLLAGDAAGLVDPLTGEGIRFAIKSGRLAAEAILSGHPEHYPSLVKRRIDRSHRQAIVLTRLFYAHPKIYFELCLPNPRLSDEMVAMFGDRNGYTTMLLHTLATFPRFILRRIAGFPAVRTEEHATVGSG